MKRLLSICLIVCLLVMAIPVVSVAATQYGVVHGGWLRLRAAASFDAATISSYNTGTTVTILNTSGSWYYVQAPDGNKGYMYSSYLTVSGSAGGGSAVGNATVWSSNGYGVRMRSGPGKGYRIIKVYSVGTVVNVLEKGAYWSRIQVGNLTGYMMNEFLTGGGAPAPSPSGNATIWSANGYGVRLRTGPGTGYGVIGVYSVGTKVTVLERGAVWDKIMVGSRVGYMMNEFLRYYSNMQVTNVTLNNTTPVVGNVLAVKTLTPADAKVSYSWLVNGIEQGTAATYTVMSADVNKTIQLKVTGIDGYTGGATSETTSAVVSDTTVTGVLLNLGAVEAPVVGNVLQVASITPANATVSYVWYVGGVQKSTASTYTVQSADVGKRIELMVKGTGVYSGTVSSGETLPVASTAPVTGVSIYLGSSALTGTPNVGDTLTAVVAPSNATVQYLWTVYNSDGTAYRTGNQKDFAITSNDAGKTIDVKVTGIAPYNDSKTSSRTAAVTNMIRITGVSLTNATSPIFEPGGTSTQISASVTPSNAITSSISYDWKVNGASTGVNTATFTVREQDIGQAVTVTITGDGVNSTGSATSAASATVKGVITNVALNNLSPNVGETITATVTPSGAAASTTFNWLRGSSVIQTGYSANYQVVAADIGSIITVQVVAGGNYMTKIDVKANTNVISATPAPTKTVTVGSQSSTLTAGTAGSVTFPVTTANIANATAISLTNTNSVAGITLGTTATTNNSTNVSISTTAATPAGSHPLILTIDGVTASFSLVVNNPSAPTKTVSVGTQNGTLTEGTGGSVTYSVSTANIADGTYAATLAGAPTGATAANVTIAGNSGTLTINTTNGTPSGNYSLTITIDSTVSGSFSLVVGAVTPPPTPEKDSLVVSEISDSGAGVLSVTVGNPNGVSVTYAWSSSTSSHTSNSLSYTLDPGDVVSTVITFTVTCGDGSSVTKTLTL